MSVLDDAVAGYKPSILDDAIAGYNKPIQPIVQDPSAPGSVMAAGPEVGQFAARAGKQTWNQGIVETAKNAIYGLGGGKVLNTVLTPLLQRDLKARGHDLSLMETSELLKQAATKHLDKIPKFDIEPPKDPAEMGADMVGSLNVFALQVAAFKQLNPSISDSVAWEISNLLAGGTPGKGAIAGKVFGSISGIKAATIAGKAGKLGLESGAMVGMTAVEGGTPAQMAMAAGVPMVAHGVGMAMEHGEPTPTPDIVKRAQPPAPNIQELPAMVSAEGAVPASETGVQGPVQDLKVQHEAHLKGEWLAENDAEQEAYDNLQDAVASRDSQKIKRAQAKYDRSKPLTQDFLRQMAEGGDQDAQVRLGLGYFIPDDVDTATPLTAQERSAAKRAGLDKSLTGYRGTMTPGQVRMILRGDQGAVPAMWEPEPESETPKPETAGQAPRLAQTPEQDQDKTDLDRDIDQTHKRMDDAAQRLTNPDGTVRLPTRLNRIEYALGKVESATGRPLLRRYQQFVDGTSEATQQYKDEVSQVLKDNGIEKFNDVPILKPESEQKVADALYYGDRSQLTPDELKLAQLADKVDTVNRKYAARAKWELFKSDAETPPGIEFKDIKRVRTEGLKAENDGKLDEWLAQQPWSARKTYYMSEHPDDVPGGDTDIIFGEHKKVPSVAIGEARARERQGKARKTVSLLTDMMNHGEHMARATIAHRDVPELWKMAKEAPFDRPSLEAFKTTLKTTTRQIPPAFGWRATFKKLNNFFWNVFYRGDVRSMNMFGVHQWKQEAQAFSQMSTESVIRGMKNISEEAIKGNPDIERVQRSARIWSPRAKESQRIISAVRDAERIPQGKYPELLKAQRGIKSLVDAANIFGGEAYMRTQKLAWNVYYSASKDSLTRYTKDGNWKSVKSDLRLDTVNTAQTDNIYYLIKKGRMNDACAMIATAKMRATHTPYEMGYRTAGEQDPAARYQFGPMTFIRGQMEAVTENGVRPFLDGIKYKDYGMANRGLKTLVTSCVTYGLTAYAFDRITGRRLPWWASLIAGGNPGVGLLVGTSVKIGQIAWEGGNRGDTTEQTADRIAKSLVNLGETSIPYVNLIAENYERVHNVQGIRLYNLVKSRLSKTYRMPERPAERTELEGWLHLITKGGFEEGEVKYQRRVKQQEAKK